METSETQDRDELTIVEFQRRVATIDREIQRHRATRFWLLTMTHFYIGTVLLVTNNSGDVQQAIHNSYVLQHLPGRLTTYVVAWLSVGMVLLVAKATERPTPMKVAHATGAGFFGLLSFMTAVSWLDGHLLYSVSLPYLIIMCWQHIRAALAVPNGARR